MKSPNSRCAKDGELHYTQRVIQVGKPVKALALGSSVTGPQADFGTTISRNRTVSENGDGLSSRPAENGSYKNSWFRYHKVEGLILATGFQNGQIRCYNACTGRSPRHACCSLVG